MTEIGTQVVTVLVAGALAAGGVIAGTGGGGHQSAEGGYAPADPAGQSGSAPRIALVVDAALARDGRELVDARLRRVDAEVRLPRTAAEALVNVRYLAALGYRLVVAGPDARAAARAAGVASLRASGLDGALAAGRAGQSASS